MFLKLMRYLLFILLFLYNCGNAEKPKNNIWKQKDIKKYQYLQNEKINLENKIKKFYKGGGQAVILKNNKIIEVGDFSGDYSYSLECQLKKSNNDIIKSKYKKRISTLKERKEVTYFESFLNNRFSDRPNIIINNEKISDLLPKGVLIKEVFKGDINKDNKEDYFIFFIFPEEYDNLDNTFNEQIDFVIILSNKDNFLLQYLGFFGFSDTTILVDMSIVNIFNNGNNQLLIRSIGVGQHWGSAISLYWLEN